MAAHPDHSLVTFGDPPAFEFLTPLLELPGYRKGYLGLGRGASGGGSKPPGRLPRSELPRGRQPPDPKSRGWRVRLARLLVNR